MGLCRRDAGVLRDRGMGYFDPDIVILFLEGHTGARSMLVQHVTQLNVGPRACPKRARRPREMAIGFSSDRRLETQEQPSRAKTPDHAHF